MNKINHKNFFAIAEHIKQMKEDRKIGEIHHNEACSYAKMLRERLDEYYDLIDWFDSQPLDLEQLKELVFLEQDFI